MMVVGGYVGGWAVAKMEGYHRIRKNSTRRLSQIFDVVGLGLLFIVVIE